MRLIPRRAAAPSAPPTRPLHSVSMRTISSCCLLECSLSALLPFIEATVSLTIREISCSDLEDETKAGSSHLDLRSSPRGASSDLPRVRITARSTKFSSSRMFPGQSQAVRPFITDTGTDSMRFCICLAHF